MKTLYHNLPLIIGDLFLKTNDERWSNFIRLLHVINLTFTFVYNDQTISDLRNEIEKYLSNFTKKVIKVFNLKLMKNCIFFRILLWS